MKKLLLILFLISIILISGCSKIQIENKKDVEGIYTRSGGLSVNPGWYDKLIVKNDGTLIKDVNSRLDKHEIRNINLSEKELKEFKEIVLEANALNFKSAYDCNLRILDVPGFRIDFNINGKTKTVYLSPGCETEIPPKLKNIVDILIKFNGKFDTID